MSDKAGKLLIATVILLALGSVLLVACSPVASASRDGSSQSTSTPAASVNKSGAAVHMNDTNFEESSVTLSKGGSLTLVDDSASVHIIQNGTWDNGIVQAGAEPGAPSVDQNFAGNDTHQIGPFTTSGTFKLF